MIECMASVPAYDTFEINIIQCWTRKSTYILCAFSC